DRVRQPRLLGRPQERVLRLRRSVDADDDQWLRHGSTSGSTIARAARARIGARPDPKDGKTAQIWAIVCRAGGQGSRVEPSRRIEIDRTGLPSGCVLLSLVYTFSRRLDLTVSTVEAAVAAKEARRWLLSLTAVLVACAVFTAAALSGLGAWLLLPAIV